jgi:uncharacterized paraquat-inducible protein A
VRKDIVNNPDQPDQPDERPGVLMNCEGCGQSIDFNPVDEGRETECPNCHLKIVLKPASPPKKKASVHKAYWAGLAILFGVPMALGLLEGVISGAGYRNDLKPAFDLVIQVSGFAFIAWLFGYPLYWIFNKPERTKK